MEQIKQEPSALDAGQGGFMRRISYFFSEKKYRGIYLSHESFLLLSSIFFVLGVVAAFVPGFIRADPSGQTDNNPVIWDSADLRQATLQDAGTSDAAVLSGYSAFLQETLEDADGVVTALCNAGQESMPEGGFSLQDAFTQKEKYINLDDPVCCTCVFRYPDGWSRLQAGIWYDGLYESVWVSENPEYSTMELSTAIYGYHGRDFFNLHSGHFDISKWFYCSDGLNCIPSVPEYLCGSFYGLTAEDLAGGASIEYADCKYIGPVRYRDRQFTAVSAEVRYGYHSGNAGYARETVLLDEGTQMAEYIIVDSDEEQVIVSISSPSFIVIPPATGLAAERSTPDAFGKWQEIGRMAGMYDVDYLLGE